VVKDWDREDLTGAHTWGHLGPCAPGSTAAVSCSVSCCLILRSVMCSGSGGIHVGVPCEQPCTWSLEEIKRKKNLDSVVQDLWFL
jgi:hypothetical protein